MINEKQKSVFMMLTYDFMFKAVFANENNINPLTKLISDYFNIDIDKVKGKVRIMNSELIKNNKFDKKKCVDVIVEINENEILNIEMNTNKSKEEFATIERNTAYICKIFSEQHKSGDTYNKTKKCIQINFNNFGVNGDAEIELWCSVILTVFLSIVIRDALGVRYTVQKLCVSVTKLAALYNQEDEVKKILDVKSGHKPHEVLAGAVLGIIVGSVSSIIYYGLYKCLPYAVIAFVVYIVVSVIIVKKSVKEAAQS